MLTCFIGCYRFNIKYFFWRAGSKVLPCNSSSSQLCATFTAQAQEGLPVTAVLLEWELLWASCGAGEQTSTRVPRTPSVPQSPNVQDPCVCRCTGLPLCSPREGGELCPFSRECKRLAGESQNKADLCLCSVLHGSHGKAIIIAARNGVLHR